MSNLYNIEVTTIDGEQIELKTYSGKVLLVVNVASACGLTPQYEGLEALYQSKRDRGLEILAFPCNQFGEQEPGTEEEIKTFCTGNFGVTFPMFSKIDVNGDLQHPLYRSMLDAIPERSANSNDFAEKLKDYGKEVNEGAVMWNFEKFLVNREGEIIGHFSPDVGPDDPLLTAAIDEALSS